MFARYEEERDPRAMLADLIVIYQLHYAVTGDVAIARIHTDTQVLKALGLKPTYSALLD